VGAGSGVATHGIPGSPGVPEAFTQLTIQAPFDDVAAVGAAFERWGDEVACVIVEPVAGNMGCVPPLPGFLQALRTLCDRYGVLLVFDEVMSGFRVAWGGAQTRYGVQPDLTCLGKVVGGDYLLPSLQTSSPTEAGDFLAEARAVGHEGIMAKDPASLYEAGRRGKGWLKVKPVHTYDLVVLAVEWGHGRRRGWLSNLHLGARDPDSGEFVMVGKTFKGLTDELLEWQTKRFLELETHRERHVVYVRPEQVVEIALDGVQSSTRYPGGVALRFARVRAYRHDRDAHTADTIDSVRALLR